MVKTNLQPQKNELIEQRNSFNRNRRTELHKNTHTDLIIELIYKKNYMQRECFVNNEASNNSLKSAMKTRNQTTVS